MYIQFDLKEYGSIMAYELLLFKRDCLKCFGSSLDGLVYNIGL